MIKKFRARHLGLVAGIFGIYVLADCVMPLVGKSIQGPAGAKITITMWLPVSVAVISFCIYFLGIITGMLYAIDHQKTMEENKNNEESK